MLNILTLHFTQFSAGSSLIQIYVLVATQSAIVSVALLSLVSGYYYDLYSNSICDLGCYFTSIGWLFGSDLCFQLSVSASLNNVLYNAIPCTLSVLSVCSWGPSELYPYSLHKLIGNLFPWKINYYIKILAVKWKLPHLLPDIVIVIINICATVGRENDFSFVTLMNLNHFWSFWKTNIPVIVLSAGRLNLYYQWCYTCVRLCDRFVKCWCNYCR